MIANFDTFLLESGSEWWRFPTRDVTSEWFNNAPESEIKKFLIGFNDGQGDHAVYTYDRILKLLQNSDRPNAKKELLDMTRTEIMDEFFNELQLNGNNSDTVYFDGKQYLKVNWK